MTDALQDYLRVIYVLSADREYVRSVEIANAIGCSKVSVHHAVKALHDEGLIDFASNKRITLTEEGRKAAAYFEKRHSYFRELLMRAGVAAEQADREAKGIVRSISDESYHALTRLL